MHHSNEDLQAQVYDAGLAIPSTDMPSPHLVRAMEEAALDRYSTTSQKPVKWRDPLGSINPFFDEPESEAEWSNLNLHGFPRGFDLVRVCLGAIRKDKEILVFQGTSMALCLLLLYVFTYWATEGFDREYFTSPLSPEITILRLFPYFVLASFISTYFSVAIMTVAIIRMKGGNPSSADGLEVATRKSLAILIWAIYSAIVIAVISLLRSREDRNGDGAAHPLPDTAELVFAAGTYFVVPIMIFENSSFDLAIKRSASILRNHCAWNSRHPPDWHHSWRGSRRSGSCRRMYHRCPLAVLGCEQRACGGTLLAGENREKTSLDGRIRGSSNDGFRVRRGRT
jgi:hypothetical protein